MDYLLKNAVVLPDFAKTDLCIIDGAIKRDVKLLTGREYKTLDLEGRLVLKGFANVHTHLDKALLNNGSKEASSLEDAIVLTHQYKVECSKEDIYRRARQIAETCWQSGTRWLRTHVDVDTLWGLKAVEALQQVKEEMASRLAIQIVAFPQEGIVNSPENYKLLEQALQSGADLVGGIPATESDPAHHIQMVMDLAKAYDVDVDMHIDETDDPSSLTILKLAEAATACHWQGRVAAGHLCSLGANPPARRAEVLSAVADAGISLVTLPSTNLYLQGRQDAVSPRRGILPVAEALEKKVTVAAASDNIQDFFNPFGSGDVLDQAWLVANCCYMGTKDALWNIFQMVSQNPAAMMGASAWVREGDPADFIILNAKSVSEAIIYRNGLFGHFDAGSFTAL